MAIRIKDFASLVPRDFAGLFGGEDVPNAIELAYTDTSKADVARRRIPFVASDDAIDLHDEIVAAGAFHQDIGVYARNPVILAQHQHRLFTGDSPVVGSAHELRTEANPFTAVVEFAEPPADRHHWALYRDGHQRAFSVGFFIKDTQKRDGRTVITRGLLIEISAVPVPANSNALVLNFVMGRLAGAVRATADAGEARELRAAHAEAKALLDDYRRLLGGALSGESGAGAKGSWAVGDGDGGDDGGADGRENDIDDDALSASEQREINECLGLK